MNDEQRDLMVSNDEGLYNLWKASGKSRRAFVRANRAMIDEVTQNIATGKKSQHYLKYG